LIPRFNHDWDTLRHVNKAMFTLWAVEATHLPKQCAQPNLRGDYNDMAYHERELTAENGQD
jgi:hypothetical protein